MFSGLQELLLFGLCGCWIGKKIPWEELNSKDNWYLRWETKLFLLMTFWSLKLPSVVLCLSKICNRYQNSVFLISFLTNNLSLCGSCLNLLTIVATNLSSASSTFFLLSLDSILSFTLFKKVSFYCSISLSFIPLSFFLVIGCFIFICTFTLSCLSDAASFVIAWEIWKLPSSLSNSSFLSSSIKLSSPSSSKKLLFYSNGCWDCCDCWE